MILIGAKLSGIYKIGGNMSQIGMRLKNEYLPATMGAVTIGIIVGIIVALFNICLNFLSNTAVTIYTYVQENWYMVPIFLAGLIILAVSMAYIHKKRPQVRGGGMPQTIALSKGEVKFKWYQVLWSNIVCSFMSFFAGLPVGAEGPSMFVGASSANGVWKTCKYRPFMRKYLITAGASSGLAATFNAPLAGILFAIEKIHRKFSPLLLYIVGIAVIFSTIVFHLLDILLGSSIEPFFNFSFLSVFPFEYFWVLIILGLAIGVSAVIFQLILTKTQSFTDKHTKGFPYWIRLICAFVFTGVIGLFFIDAITGGRGLIEKVSSADFSLQLIGILLLIKLFLITVCYNSGATGGLFIPSLCIGALVGGLCGHLFMICGLPSEYYTSIVCFSMLGFLTGMTHAPMSSLVLLIEMTGFTGNLLSCGIVIVAAYTIALVLRPKSLYEEQVDRLVKNTGYNESEPAKTKHIEVTEKSVLINKRVSDIFLPQSVAISSITRNDKKIVSDSETRFRVGDKVQFIYQGACKEKVGMYLKDIAGKPKTEEIWDFEGQ